MPKPSRPQVRLEDLPNIGPSIAADLRGIGILEPAQLATRDPLAVYLALGPRMEHRHDPCVLYTLMAARHFLDTGDVVRWWTFTEAGKRLLAEHATTTPR
ncbi:MAG: helix-hairpin-helix domain-containing protein [Moraxellaceae bacterium]|nr:helix-hairpin-helix domain-containing protein [Moraxellaceae bacterium]